MSFFLTFFSPRRLTLKLYGPGSPLNRVSFLRTDNSFLSNALRHPTSRFLLLNQLAPLVRSPSEIFYASYQDVETLVPQDLFDKSEEDTLKAFDSTLLRPHLVFLGLDEGKKENGLAYKIYKGTPYFALDVTPRGTFQKPATGVLEAMEARGLSFHKGRAVMTLPADDGIPDSQNR